MYFQTEPGVRVRVEVQRREGAKGNLLLVHGLEGSSEGGYMRSMAQSALEAGYNVFRSNIRGCGGTEGLSNTLYHAGLTSDVLFIAHELRRQSDLPLFVAGFSLGGNQVLKLAGELGEQAGRLFAGVIAISTPIDLHACVNHIARRENRLYEWRFVASMRQRMRARHRLMPDVFRLDGVDQIRSVYDFDDRVTAPFFGFGTADRYYALNSSQQFLEAIRVPTLLIQAKDDPMIPFGIYSRQAFSRNSWLRLVAVDHGGHVGFLSRDPEARFWVDGAAVAWIKQVLTPP